MKQTMGTIDRAIRTLLAIPIAVLYFTGEISGTTALVLGILAIVFLATSAVSFCPLYTPFRITTRTKQ